MITISRQEIETRRRIYEHSFNTLMTLHMTVPKPWEVCMHMMITMDESPEKIAEILKELDKMENE